MRTLIAGLAAVTTAAAALPAAAHDIWVVTEGQGVATIGKIRFGDPSKLEVADFHKIVSLEVVSAGGAVSLKRPLKPAASGKTGLDTKAFTPPAVGIIAITYDNGYYAVDPADKLESNTSKLLMPKASESWWVPKFGKTLLGAGSYKIAAHALLELTPLNDPYATPAGQSLKVRLEHAGKPVPNADVTYTDGLAPIPEKTRPAVKTDKDGVATIPLARKGAYLLTADILTAASHPDLSDKDELYATLAFDTGS